MSRPLPRYARLGLKNSYKMRMLMGLFDPTKDNAYKHIPTDIVGCDAHQEMSLTAARKGMVLLKQGPLPFAKGARMPHNTCVKKSQLRLFWSLLTISETSILC